MGKVICVGLGPGDPELMSVKADRLLRNARHVAYFRKRGHPGKARQLVNGLLHAEAHNRRHAARRGGRGGRRIFRPG